MPAPTLRQARDEAAAWWYFDRFLDRIEEDPEAARRLGRVLSDALVDRIEDDPDFAHRLLRIIHRIDWPIAPPPPPTARLIREEPGPMFVFEPEFTPSEDPDVVLREIELVIDGGPPEILDVTDGPVEFRVPRNAEFALRFRETDRDENASEWSDAYMRDTIPPPTPAAPTARLIREEPDEPVDGDGGAGDAGGDATAPEDGGATPVPDAGAGDTGADAGTGGATPAPGTPGGDAGTGDAPAPAPAPGV